MIDLKKRSEFLIVLAAACLIFLAAGQVFHAKDETLLRTIRAKAIEYAELKSIVSEKNDIQAKYSQLNAGRSFYSSADWVRFITDVSKEESVNIESIIPKASSNAADRAESKYMIKFKTSPDKLAGFLYGLSSKDPLSKIDAVNLTKTPDSFLNCEIDLSRVFPK